MIVVVTGANGFIGRHFVKDQLSRGRRVRATDITLSGLEGLRGNPLLDLFPADIRDAGRIGEVLTGSDVVVHLASAHLQINVEESEYWHTNVDGLQNVLEASERNGVQRFVHVSSVGVYGNLHSWPADEESPCSPESAYGKSKLAGENRVRQFSKSRGFPVVIMRPAWVFGAGCPRTLKIYRALRNKHFVMIGEGHNLRHPIYISDMVDALVLAMESANAVGELFVVAGTRPMTSGELLDSFCNVFNIPHPKYRIPHRLGVGLATACEMIARIARMEPPFSRRSIEFFQTNNAFDVSKVTRYLGFNPKFSFEDGLHDSREWILANA